MQDGGLELYPQAGSAANIGIMLFRPTAAEFAKVVSSACMPAGLDRRAFLASACCLNCTIWAGSTKWQGLHGGGRLQAWLDLIVADDNLWDQNAFNQLMQQGMVFSPPREDRLFL